MPDNTAPQAANWLARSVHTVAVFEMLKGVAALLLAWGFITVQRHGDLHEWAVALVGRLHLHADSRWPALLLHEADRLQEVHIGQVAALAVAYAALRLAEGWGLWHDKRWAEWLAALSTGLYLPFELAHLLHKPGVAAAAVFAFNLAVLGLMVGRLRRRR